MYQFKDVNDCVVRITFDQNEFVEDPKHVWVICRYLGKWLLTNHSIRGLEFPGGKLEKGESVLDAAKREVWEETGAEIESLFYIGQYEVLDGTSSFVKAIFFADIGSIERKSDYMETKGPILLDLLPETIKADASFSFVMQDEVLPLTLKQIAKMDLI